MQKLTALTAVILFVWLASYSLAQQGYTIEESNKLNSLIDKSTKKKLTTEELKQAQSAAYRYLYGS